MQVTVNIPIVSAIASAACIFVGQIGAFLIGAYLLSVFYHPIQNLALSTALSRSVYPYFLFECIIFLGATIFILLVSRKKISISCQLLAAEAVALLSLQFLSTVFNGFGPCAMPISLDH